MNMKRLAAALFFFCLSASALAQQVPPYVYPVTLGTSQASILPANTARKKLIFTNPNATAFVAVCPAGPSRSNGAAITAAINGPGCTTLLPYQSIEISGSTASGPQQSMPSAWIGIASAGGSALSIYEFE
jgi:flavoprotein